MNTFELGYNEATRAAMIEAARAFLSLADERNEDVSAYIDGSNRPEAKAAYFAVLEAEDDFLYYYCAYCGEPHRRPCLGYDLAESVLPEDDPYFNEESTAGEQGAESEDAPTMSANKYPNIFEDEKILSANEAFAAYISEAPEEVAAAAYKVGEDVVNRIIHPEPELSFGEIWDKISDEIYLFQSMKAAVEAIERQAAGLRRMTAAQKKKVYNMLAQFAISTAKESFEL